MDQTRQNIIDAAMELVVERGYTATTTKDIAKLFQGLRTPELAEDTREGILAIPQVFKTGVMEYLRKMYDKDRLISDDCEKVHQLRIQFNVTLAIARYVYVYIIMGNEGCYLVYTGVKGCDKKLGNIYIILGKTEKI